MSILDHIRPEAREAPYSGISAVVVHGWNRGGVIPLWAGEGDEPTPAFISDAAAEGLRNGETFYTWQLGHPELRRAIADYHGRHFGRVFQASEFVVTGSGMHAISMALQIVAGPGDEVAYLSPAWPNFSAAAGLAGISAVPVLLQSVDGDWRFDAAALEAAITPRTRALFINSPSNPTGWTATLDELRTILALARRHGVWIIADEIYALYAYGAARSPSFFDIMDEDDRILFVNSFSKNWAMTGWRIGWMRVPQGLLRTMENLVQYTNSGVPQFLQRGAIAALDKGDDYVRYQVERAEKARDLAVGILSRSSRIDVAAPAGAFYLFFGVDGVVDSTAAAFSLIDECGVGLAPGTAFGRGGERFLRMCFHRRLDELGEAAERIVAWADRYRVAA